jgi:hypothetical protein
MIGGWSAPQFSKEFPAIPNGLRELRSNSAATTELWASLTMRTAEPGLEPTIGATLAAGNLFK